MVRIFKLTGKTRHGKNRVNEHGSVWFEEPQSRDWSKVLVRSLKTNDLRWINIFSYVNFEVERLNG